MRDTARVGGVVVDRYATLESSVPLTCVVHAFAALRLVATTATRPSAKITVEDNSI